MYIYKEEFWKFFLTSNLDPSCLFQSFLSLDMGILTVDVYFRCIIFRPLSKYRLKQASWASYQSCV